MARSGDYDNDHVTDRGFDHRRKTRHQEVLDEFYYAYCPECDADTPHEWDDCMRCEEDEAIQRLKDTEDKDHVDAFGRDIAEP